MPNQPTYRKIADLAGVSVFSVSCALRNRPGVSAETRERIREIAEKIGYRPNPLVTALMTRHRTQNNRRQMRAILACLLDRLTRSNRAKISTNRESHAGYQSACDEAGFITEEFIVEDFESNPRRLFSALRARRVPGVIIQAGTLPEWCSQGWENYALASVGNRQLRLPSHFAGTDHYRNSWLAASKLAELGYKRIGFAMSRKDWVASVDYRALAAYLAWTTQSGLPMFPAHWTETWERDAFLRWVNKHRPDVIIAAEHEPLNFLKEDGWKIPDDIGFAHLGLDSSWKDLAGIRQNNFQVGEAAAQLVIDQINRNAYGPPEHPRSIQISGDWFDGPSVRRR